jgi:hypothetical protein
VSNTARAAAGAKKQKLEAAGKPKWWDFVCKHFALVCALITAAAVAVAAAAAAAAKAKAQQRMPHC